MSVGIISCGWSQICESYPEQLIVPKAIEDEVILKSSQFRHHKRFPIVCYYHQKMKVSWAQVNSTQILYTIESTSLFYLMHTRTRV